jgi:hypothetical protein
MASVIVTGSLVITGSTFVGAGTVTDGLDFYFDVGNINSFDYINNNKSTLRNIAKGGGNPYISASFNIRTGSVSETTSPTSSYTPEFGGCLFVSRSTGAGANQIPAPAIIFHQTTAPVTNTQFNARYLNGRSELTLGIWHRVIALGVAGSQGSFFYAGTILSAERPFDIYAVNNGIQMQARFPNIAIPPANPVFSSAVSPAGVLYQWNYFVCVFNNGTITVYTNGIPGASVTVNQTTIKPGQSFVAGGSASGPNSNQMIGNIGPVQIYGRALTQQEILQNYHTMKSRFGIYT